MPLRLLLVLLVHGPTCDAPVALHQGDAEQHRVMVWEHGGVCQDLSVARQTEGVVESGAGANGPTSC